MSASKNQDRRYNKMTLFDYPQKDYDYIENGKKKFHTPRQWKLYEFYKTHDLKGMTQEDILVSYDWWVQSEPKGEKYIFGYFKEQTQSYYKNKPFANYSSAREYRKDKQALQKSETITVVITEYGLARTEKEAQAFLNKSLIKILKMLKRYHRQNNKLNKHYQTRLVFNSEKDIIEAIKELEESWRRENEIR